MKSRILHVLAGGGAILTVIASADLKGYTAILPPNLRPWLAIATPAAAALLHFVTAIGDVADDGQQNGSFKPFNFKCAPFAFLAAGALAVLGMTSCVSTTDAKGVITRTPDRGLIDTGFEYGFRVLDRYFPPKATVVTEVTPAK